MLIRAVQGLGSACIQVSVFSIIGIMYPDSESNELYYGYCESATGIGLMAGPIIGQVIYNHMGFQGCFYSTAFLMMIGGVLSWRFIGDEVNE